MIKIKLFSYYCFILLICGMGTVNYLQAQVVLESFEMGPTCNTNYHQNNAFYEGCIDDWIAVAGTPNTEMFEPVVEIGTATFTAFHGDYYARTYSGRPIGCNNDIIGESMALEYPFKQCVDYDLSFRLAKRTLDPAGFFEGEHPVKVTVALAKNLSNLSPPTNNCLYEQLYLNGSMQHLLTVIYDASPTDQEPVWSLRTNSFTPDEDYTHLIFFPEYQSDATSGVYVYYDDFKLIEGPSPEYPDFYTTTEEDKPQEKTEFCHDEEVWICLGDANFQWDNTIFSLFKDGANNAYSTTGVVMDIKANNCYNFSQLLRDNGYEGLFEVNLDYRIEMSIEQPGCGWVDRYFDFQVICCEEEPDASFTYALDLFSTPASLTAQADNDYTGNGGTHQFCLYVDTDLDGTPNSVINCSNSLNFSYLTLVSDWVYYLEHCVETDCAIDCKIVEIRPNLLIVRKHTCEVSLFRCLQNNNQTYLSWAATPDILSFEVEIQTNDPNCGCGGTPSFTRFTTDDSFVRLDFTPECFSFRVKTVCEERQSNGEVEIVEEWSPFTCANCNDLDFVVDDPNTSETRSAAIAENANPGTTMIINPNPFTSEFNLQLGAIDLTVSEVGIYTMDGKLIHHQQGLQSGVIDLSHSSYRGLLWVQVKVGDRFFNQKVLKL